MLNNYKYIYVFFLAGNCIRQSSAIIYIASVLSARRKFYSDIWFGLIFVNVNNMSMLILG